MCGDGTGIQRAVSPRPQPWPPVRLVRDAIAPNSYSMMRPYRCPDRTGNVSEHAVRDRTERVLAQDAAVQHRTPLLPNKCCRIRDARYSEPLYPYGALLRRETRSRPGAVW